MSLYRLAESYGVARRWTDIWGRRREVSEATLRFVLQQMGVEAGSRNQIEAALMERERAQWSRLLEPVVVVSEPYETVATTLTVRSELAGHPDARVPWTVHGESGEIWEGEVSLADLAVVSQQTIDGEMRSRLALVLPVRPPCGYHELHVRIGQGDRHVDRTRVIVAPEQCHWPVGLRGEQRIWGPALQLASVRSERSWGIGEYSDLAAAVDLFAGHGAGMVGVGPMHAPLSYSSSECSPYAPSSRLFLNTLYIDVAAAAERQQCAEVLGGLASAEHEARRIAQRSVDLVEPERVAELKWPWLERLWEHFDVQHRQQGSQLAGELEGFVRRGGAALRAFATFQAIQEWWERNGGDPGGWLQWPEELRRPDSDEVAAFADEHWSRVELYLYLQWLADEQLAAAGRRCLEHRLKVGLYQDLAVGSVSGGFDSWWRQGLYAPDARQGSPPDDFNLYGQEWGLPPMIPEVLRAHGYEPFAEALRATMRHAGAVRIDHVMGLMQSFWVPPDTPPEEGTYVSGDLDEMLAVVALESQRNRCLVVGEDLGTVPDEVRAALAPRQILSYRLLLHATSSDGSFLPPEAFPERSLVAIGSHDLPTLVGFWEGRDLALRDELGLFPDEAAHERQLVRRSEDRVRLLLALDREDLLPEGVTVDLAQPPEMGPELVRALHEYLARTPARLLSVQLEDVLGQREQVNLPGTTTEHPNWRRKLPATLEELAEDPRLVGVVERLRRLRHDGRVPVAQPDSGRRRPPEVPVATYRLQLGDRLGFADVEALLPYLDRLGISHVYLSPCLKSRSGSSHGYDIIDHTAFDPTIGTAEEYDRLVAALRGRGMGIVLDLVPNHMGIGSDNRWWMDVLEHGPASRYAQFFDIEWWPAKEELRGQVLLPLLEDQYGVVLDRGLLELRFDAAQAALQVAYHEHRFPIDPATWPIVLGHDLSRLQARLGGASELYRELQALMDAMAALPSRQRTDPNHVRLRRRDAAVYREQLARLYRQHPEIAAFIDANVAVANGADGRTDRELLHRLLAAQAYRLAYWRVASDEINYRRFFDINDLAALQMDNPEVRAATHTLVDDLRRGDALDGVRIDHPDGLADPAGYFAALRDELDRPATAEGAQPRSWIVVEKILADHESLPEQWPVDGTTGYEFAALVGGLWVDPDAERAMEHTYSRFIGHEMDFDQVVYSAKQLILQSALSSELAVLADALDRISEADRRTRDFTRQQLQMALAEVIAWFPVYRTYATRDGLSDEDRRYVEWAVARARSGARTFETSVYGFLRQVLTLDAVNHRSPADREAIHRFVTRFQQTTAPVMAKGLEDTALYIHNRLLANNDVGAEPRHWAVSKTAFHHANSRRLEQWPRAMLTTSTHDSKRSEDVRARIAALSEIPERWRQAVRRFTLLNRSRKRQVAGQLAPSKNDEYAIYQTLVGVWPFEAPSPERLEAVRERVQGAVVKAVREAKVHTSWINPDLEYEAAVTEFLDGILVAGDSDLFMEAFVSFQRLASRIGMVNSWGQVLIKLTAPGVPDLYQGAESWILNLVDPDNRRPVPFAELEQKLDRMQEVAAAPAEEWAAAVSDMLASPGDGRLKLWLTWRTLRLRQQHPELFQSGAYVPVESTADDGNRHLCGFVRRAGEISTVTVASRFPSQLCDIGGGAWPVGASVWSTDQLALPEDLSGRQWRNVLTGELLAGAAASPNLPVAEVLRTLPVALLLSEG